MKIYDIIDQTRGDLRPTEALFALIEMAANLNSKNLPLTELRCAEYARRGAALHLLESGAKILLDEDREGRFQSLVTAFDRLDTEWVGEFWIRGEACNQLLALVGDTMSVRFSYSTAFRPCLTYAYRMAMRDRAPRIEFCSVNAEQVNLMIDLAQILDLADIIRVETAWPWKRANSGEVSLEVMLPPFGMTIRDDEDIPQRILGNLGVDDGRRGRLNAESVAIADILEHSKGRAIICVSDGALFRMVGTEPIARRNLIDSGRIKAVLAVPPGLMFTHTMIKTNLVMLSSSLDDDEDVRIANLGHDSVAHKGRRGRFEMTDGAKWTDALHTQALEFGLGRDVSRNEMAANNYVLTTERYLNTGPRERIDALLAKSDEKTLEEIVEMIRPISLTQDENGEFLMFEASPSDVSKLGFVGKPARAIAIDRTKYNKATNQQLRPGDLILAIKGTIGVVGMVPDTVPGDGEQEIWTAGQSMMLLRPKKRSGVSPLALYEYLSDDTVQDFLKSIAGGAGILNLSMKDLKDFPVPMPDAATVAEVERGFAERLVILEQIEELRAQERDVRGRNWPHRDLAPPSS